MQMAYDFMFDDLYTGFKYILDDVMLIRSLP